MDLLKPTLMPNPNPDAIKDLGLEAIADKQTQQEVTDFFQARADLLAEIVSDRQQTKDLIQKKINEYNRRQVQTQQIIDDIVTALQKDALERDLNEGYIDANGQKQESYIEQFHKEVERVGVDFEGDDKDRNNPVRQACLTEVVKAIRAIPANLKRSYRHEYVKDMIADYVRQMDKKAEWMKIGTLHLEELKDLKIKSIQDWMNEPGRPSETELMQKYNPNQAKEFIQTEARIRDNLTKISQQTAAFSPELKQYFDARVANIEQLRPQNSSQAADDAQKLADEASAVTGMIALKGEISAKSAETTDEAIKKRYADLSAKIDANLKAIPQENDPSKRQALIDLSALQAEKSRLDASAAAPQSASGEQPQPASGEQSPPAQENSAPDFSNDPRAWLKYQFAEFKKYIDEVLGFFTGILGFFGVKTAFVAATDTSGGKTAAEKVAPDKLEAASKFLKENFKVSDEEFKKLAEIRLSDFMELNSAPSWMDTERFAKLRKAIVANKTNADNEKMLLLEFIAVKKNNWSVPVTQAPATAARSYIAPAK